MLKDSIQRQKKTNVCFYLKHTVEKYYLRYPSGLEQNHTISLQFYFSKGYSKNY